MVPHPPYHQLRLGNQLPPCLEIASNQDPSDQAQNYSPIPSNEHNIGMNTVMGRVLQARSPKLSIQESTHIETALRTTNDLQATGALPEAIDLLAQQAQDMRSAMKDNSHSPILVRIKPEDQPHNQATPPSSKTLKTRAPPTAFDSTKTGGARP